MFLCAVNPWLIAINKNLSLSLSLSCDTHTQGVPHKGWVEYLCVEVDSEIRRLTLHGFFYFSLYCECVKSYELGLYIFIHFACKYFLFTCLSNMIKELN